jgi:hypothetical protein
MIAITVTSQINPNTAAKLFAWAAATDHIAAAARGVVT